jgi:putative addiction module component (TIGR02574 family)
MPPPGFDELSVEENLDYLQALWARITAHPDAVPVPDWHRSVIAERLAAHRAGRGSSRSWEEVRGELLAQLRTERR